MYHVVKPVIGFLNAVSVASFMIAMLMFVNYQTEGLAYVGGTYSIRFSYQLMFAISIVCALITVVINGACLLKTFSKWNRCDEGHQQPSEHSPQPQKRAKAD